ncbi:MAG: hypothetical protein WD269_00065 [Acidimicrobiia bacterium]
MTTTHDSDEAARRTRRLMEDVQRFGWASAATVVDRYTALVDRAMVDDRIGSPSPSDEADPGRLVDSAVRLAGAYLRFLDTTAVLVASRRGGAPSEMERIVLPAARPGSGSETSLWIHNPVWAPSTGIEVEVTRLISPEGVAIPGEAVWTTPHRVDRLEPSSSREVRLHVNVPADQPAGSYFGLAVITAAPGHPIALQLDVESADEGKEGRS